MPDMPPDPHPRVDGLHSTVDQTIDLLLAVRPKLFPCEDLGVVQQESPERDEISIGRPMALPRRAHEAVQFNEALARALHRYPSVAGLLAAVLAKARDPGPSP